MAQKEQPEFQLQKQLAAYLNRQYPRVMFLSDTVAFLKLTFPQQARNKAIQDDDFHCPDLIVFAPRQGFNGLFLELKSETPWKADGVTLRKTQNNHVDKQLATIERLRAEGYIADFCWTFEQGKALLDDYLR